MPWPAQLLLSKSEGCSSSNKANTHEIQRVDVTEVHVKEQQHALHRQHAKGTPQYDYSFTFELSIFSGASSCLPVGIWR